jgi:imidazolonepropionase
MQKKQWDAIWINGLVATCEGSYGLIQEAGVAVKNGCIAWVGKMSDLPGLPEDLAEDVYDAIGCTLTPGLIDCHTHLVYAGNRAHEFEQRLQGISYAEIAAQGGGIQSTVAATRQASEEELLQQSLPRAQALMASGVTTLEIKSGYGLDWPTELKILTVAQRIQEILPLTVSKTFLGAHSLPPEYKDQADAYIDLVCDTMLSNVANEKLADAVDVFCEHIAFNLEQTERVFKAAKKVGLKLKCHAEQLSASGAAALAAKHHALSVDHLEYLTQQGVEAIAQSQTVAVLLPGAYYFLRELTLPPLSLLRQYQVPIAIASDCNPGTSPIMSLLLILNLACTQYSMTPEEALLGVTCAAAKALGMEMKIGSLTVGKSADMAVWEVSHPSLLAYYMGNNPLRQLIKNGKIVIALL